ncbi:MAG: hypothetical protein JO164_02130, partial [Candidatus Eremiobacteraeota bacterium]|nr:hypothetical protein [Candidatus Eremiobacteraeota bacterium]
MAWIVAIGLGVAFCAAFAVALVRRVVAEARRRAADAVARQLRVLDAVGDAIYI